MNTPLPELHAHVADPRTLARLRAIVRRRVPDRDAEDVVQTVVADALAAGAKPETREAVQRWIAGIARHKVADYHRRGGREVPAAATGEAEPTSPAPFEERELLALVQRELAADPDAARTLDWVVREHEGEELRGIAEAERLAPTAVRKRVSRLRKALRSRWLAFGGAGAVLLALGWGAGTILDRAPEPSSRIAAEPSASAPRAPAPAPTSTPDVPHARALGTWKVAKVERLDIADARLRKLALELAQGATVEVRASDVLLKSGPASQTYTLATSPSGGDVAFVLSDARGPVLRGTGKLQPDGSLRVRFKSGPSSGEAVLER